MSDDEKLIQLGNLALETLSMSKTIIRQENQIAHLEAELAAAREERDVAHKNAEGWKNAVEEWRQAASMYVRNKNLVEGELLETRLNLIRARESRKRLVWAIRVGYQMDVAELNALLKLEPHP